MPDERAEAMLMAMKQVLVVFRLREGSHEEAARLAAADLPFDPLEAGFKRLAVYVTEREAIFVLEGDDPEWREDDIIDDFLHPLLGERLEEWRAVADVRTWPLHPILFWEAPTETST
jgi:hypothetical protein